MSKIFLVKGNHLIHRLEAMGSKVHAITAEGTFKVRENDHSNTFLSYPSLTPVSKIYELSPLNYKEIYDFLQFSTILDLQWWESHFSESELTFLKTKYFLLIKGQQISKVSYGEIVKILKYLQSLEKPTDFNLYENSNNGANIKSWVLDTFKGTSVELGFFILLDCSLKGNLGSFICEWKNADLFGIDIKELIDYIDNSFLEKSEKVTFKSFLAKFL